MKIVGIFLCLILLIGCNAIIGIPSDTQEQPWRSIYLFSMITILIIPILSLGALLYSFWQNPTFKLKLETYLNCSVIAMGFLWMLGELSLPAKVNIRLDLFLIIPAFGIQLAMIAIGTFIADRAEKTSNK